MAKNGEQPKVGQKSDSELTELITKQGALEQIIKIFDNAETELSPTDRTKVSEVLHRINALQGVKNERKKDIITKLITSDVNRLISDNPELGEHASELVELLENFRPGSTQKILQQHFSPVKTSLDGSLEDKIPSIQELNPESKTLELTNKPTLQIEPQSLTQNVETAKDSVIFGPENDPKLSVTVSDVVDPITQAIRDEVITTQQLLLQQEIARNMEEGSAKEAFQKQNLTALRSYLASEKGREAVAQVMQNPEMQSQMHKIESAGYKAVHSKFQDSFRNVDWGQLGANKIRTTEITNDAGESVCTLKETTIDTAPTKLALDNGKTIEVKNYRQIDFPKELATGNGPMHVSMALKDENGRNMPERDAVYFTAHYDDSGKLTEVSSPVPVKFMGKGDDAIGYIERDGKVFTLPVTQGKYHEMMQEVAKNQGMNVDISQTVEMPEKQAQDRVVVPEQSGEQQLQAQKAKPVKPVVNTPLSSSDMEKQLQAQKEKLKPVDDRELAPKPEQPKSFEQELIDTKKTLKLVSKRNLAPKPEQPLTLKDELTRVIKARGQVNAITGKPVDPVVVTTVKATKTKLDSGVNQHQIVKMSPKAVAQEIGSSKAR